MIQEGNMLMATDRSVSNKIILFAWKICDNQGKTLIHHTGPVFSRESLFRAEAYSVLLVMCFLCRWIEYLRYNKEIGVTIHLDNEGIIKQIIQQKSYSHEYLFHTINPDWDVIAQICNVIKSITISKEFIHVKGHQDDAIPYKELDLPAQMKIDIDFLAVDYRATVGCK
eukprot:3179603-Ditylum_brightwellii.AAC.1